MQAERVLETCLYAEDLAAAEAFYTRVLGLQVIAREAGRHVFFAAGDGVFLVFNPETTSRPGLPGLLPHGARGPGHAAFAMREAEIEAWREHLKRHEVTIDSEIRWPSGGHSLYFRDPAGNILELATPSVWGLSEPSNG